MSESIYNIFKFENEVSLDMSYIWYSDKLDSKLHSMNANTNHDEKSVVAARKKDQHYQGK
jgi:hypothetical protein